MQPNLDIDGAGLLGLDAGPCEPRVRAAVDGVFDWVYDGHGNWPFNTAYAAAQGMEGYVARFTSLAQAEPWIAAGVPVVMSIAWKKGDITGSTIPSTNGHLLVLVGFDAERQPDRQRSGRATMQVRVTYCAASLSRSGFVLGRHGVPDLPTWAGRPAAVK